MTAVVESINQFIESTDTTNLFKWLDIEEHLKEVVGNEEDSVTINEFDDSPINKSEAIPCNRRKSSDSDDYGNILLPPSFDELAEGAFPMHKGLAENWNDYFIQVGDWLVR